MAAVSRLTGSAAYSKNGSPFGGVPAVLTVTSRNVWASTRLPDVALHTEEPQPDFEPLEDD